MDKDKIITFNLTICHKWSNTKWSSTRLNVIASYEAVLPNDKTQQSSSKT